MEIEMSTKQRSYLILTEKFSLFHFLVFNHVVCKLVVSHEVLQVKQC